MKNWLALTSNISWVKSQNSIRKKRQKQHPLRSQRYLKLEDWLKNDDSSDICVKHPNRQYHAAKVFICNASQTLNSFRYFEVYFQSEKSSVILTKFRSCVFSPVLNVLFHFWDIWCRNWPFFGDFQMGFLKV